MLDKNVFEYIEQLQSTQKKQEAQIAAFNYLLLVLIKNNENLPTISKEYSELLISLAHHEKIDLNPAEEMKKVLHNLHEIFMNRNDFS